MEKNSELGFAGLGKPFLAAESLLLRSAFTASRV